MRVKVYHQFSVVMFETDLTAFRGSFRSYHQNRRIDHLLHVLLRIARDMAFGQLIKVEKGKLTHGRCEINKRHQVAANTKDTKLQKGKTEAGL